MVRIGIIGTGTWGKNHVRVLNELEGAELSVVSDLDEKSLKRFRSIYNVKTTPDYGEVLADSDIDAVSICTPASTHYRIVKDALKAGKHVLVEKPLSLRSSQGQELTELAEKKGLTLMVGHIFRFHPAVLRLKEEIRKGTFGKIRFMYGSRMGLMTPRSDCGVITDFALHDIDMFCFLLDRYPREITSVGSFYSNPEFEDIGFCTLRFNENIIANVGVSWLTPKKVRELWIVGDKKSGRIDFMSHGIEVFDRGIVPEYDSFGEFKLVTKEGDDIRLSVPNKEPLKEEISHFIDCVKNGSRPLVDGKQGNDIVRIIELAYVSLREKRSIGVEI